MYPIRELLYEEKPLSAWNIDTEGLYHDLFEELLKVNGFRTRDIDAAGRITRLFNDAKFLCVLCTDFLKYPSLHVGDFVEWIKSGVQKGDDHDALGNPKYDRYCSLVLVFTFYMLYESIGYREKNKEIEKTVSAIRNYLKSKTEIKDTYYAIQQRPNILLKSGSREFKRRKLTPELLTSIEWNKVTKWYDLDAIREIVLNYSRNETEKLALIDAIEKHVKESQEKDPDGNLPF